MPQSFDKRIARYSTRSLLALATAAGASPSSRHRWQSVAHLVSQVLASASAQPNKTVSVEELSTLLDAARRDDPRIAALEDFMPNDPRLVALVRHDDALLRLFPGQVERPVADVERTAMVSAAVDEVLVQQRGFGVADYAAVALIYLDHVVRGVGPSWDPNASPALTDKPAVSSAEIAASATLVTSPLPRIATSGRRQSALAFATAEVTSLRYTPDHPQSTFGRHFAISLPEGVWPESRQQLSGGRFRWWLPAAFIPEALGYGVSELARETADDPGCARRFASIAASRVRRALWRFGDVLGPPDIDGEPTASPRNVVQWVVPFGGARALLVQLVARLSQDQAMFKGLPAAVRVCQDANANPDVPIVVPMPGGGELSLYAGTEVVPLVLIAGAGHLVAPQVPGVAGMSLEDLVWASRTADSKIDLFLFCRQLADLQRVPMIGWEAIDYWEWWRANDKAFFAGGKAPDLMSIAAHGGNAEWLRAGEQAQWETALWSTGLPPVAAFDVSERTGAGPPALYAWGGPAEVQHQ